MGLFGNTTEVTIALESEQVVAGQPVRAKVTIGEPDKKSLGGRVELVYRNTFQRDEYSNNSSSNIGTPQKHTTTKTETVEVVSRPLASGGQVTQGETVIELPVPADAPASSAKTVVWEVRAVVDRKRAMDAEAEAKLTVLSPAGSLADWTQGATQSSSDRCRVDIDVPTREVRPGQQVSGSVTLHPTETASARAIRAQLHMVRYDQDKNTTEKTVGETVLASDVELQSGTPWQGSFALTVPTDAAPSFNARYNSQHWYVEVVVDRKRAGDYEGRLEVVVHTG